MQISYIIVIEASISNVIVKEVRFRMYEMNLLEVRSNLLNNS